MKQEENVQSRRYISGSKSAKFLKYAQDVFMKSSQNSFETLKGCLPWSIRPEITFFPTGNKKNVFS